MCSEAREETQSASSWLPPLSLRVAGAGECQRERGGDGSAFRLARCVCASASSAGKGASEAKAKAWHAARQRGVFSATRVGEWWRSSVAQGLRLASSGAYHSRDNVPISSASNDSTPSDQPPGGNSRSSAAAASDAREGGPEATAAQRACFVVSLVHLSSPR